MSTSIGRLRYKVALQSATNTSDGAGGVTESWDTIANIYADITLSLIHISEPTRPY